MTALFSTLGVKQIILILRAGRNSPPAVMLTYLYVILTKPASARFVEVSRFGDVDVMSTIPEPTVIVRMRENRNTPVSIVLTGVFRLA